MIHAIDTVLLPHQVAKAEQSLIGTQVAAKGAVVEVVRMPGGKENETKAATIKAAAPGFESVFAVAGLLSIALIICRRRD